MNVLLNPPRLDEIEFEPGLNMSNDRFCVIGKWRGFKSTGYGITRAQAESDCQRSIQSSFVAFYERNFEDRVTETPDKPAPLVPYTVKIAYENVYTVEVMLRSGATLQEVEEAAKNELEQLPYPTIENKVQRVYVVAWFQSPITGKG